ncbi:hypothetical protein CC86DRAFT_408263 [Ophiobolus disseminans]|uniref:Uncharacterized protein n=1 Tax=Ophiobolus disseminans TaxID=1469910 RepID=A0A6A6ZTS0_9PLEO|nr:hypothetical protein CC86DRAFT_408263 [Ophiobolus disseminans]
MPKYSSGSHNQADSCLQQHHLAPQLEKFIYSPPEKSGGGAGQIAPSTLRTQRESASFSATANANRTYSSIDSKGQPLPRRRAERVLLLGHRAGPPTILPREKSSNPVEPPSGTSDPRPSNPLTYVGA